MPGFNPHLHNNPDDILWCDENLYGYHLLRDLDIFDLLCLDPRHSYNYNIVRGRVRLVRRELHPDRMQFRWGPSRQLRHQDVINFHAIDALIGFLDIGGSTMTTTFIRRWQNICLHAFRWRSTWNCAGDEWETFNSPIHSYRSNHPQPVIVPQVPNARDWATPPRPTPPPSYDLTDEPEVAPLNIPKVELEVTAANSTTLSASYLRDLAGRPNAIVMAERQSPVVQGPVQPTRPHFAVVVSMWQNVVNYRVKKCTIYGEPIDTPYRADQPKASSMNQAKFFALAKPVGPFRGYSQNKIRWFLQYMVHYSGLVPIDAFRPTQKGTMWRNPTEEEQRRYSGTFVNTRPVYTPPVPGDITITHAPVRGSGQRGPGNMPNRGRRARPSTSSSRPGPSSASKPASSSTKAGPSSASKPATSSTKAGPSSASKPATSSTKAGPSTASKPASSSTKAGPSTASKPTSSRPSASTLTTRPAQTYYSPEPEYGLPRLEAWDQSGAPDPYARDSHATYGQTYPTYPDIKRSQAPASRSTPYAYDPSHFASGIYTTLQSSASRRSSGQQPSHSRQPSVQQPSHSRQSSGSLPSHSRQASGQHPTPRQSSGQQPGSRQSSGQHTPTPGRFDQSARRSYAAYGDYYGSQYASASRPTPSTAQSTYTQGAADRSSPPPPESPSAAKKDRKGKGKKTYDDDHYRKPYSKYGKDDEGPAPGGTSGYSSGRYNLPAPNTMGYKLN